MKRLLACIILLLAAGRAAIGQSGQQQAGDGRAMQLAMESLWRRSGSEVYAVDLQSGIYLVVDTLLATEDGESGLSVHLFQWDGHGWVTSPVISSNPPAEIIPKAQYLPDGQELRFDYVDAPPDLVQLGPLRPVSQNPTSYFHLHVLRWNGSRFEEENHHCGEVWWE